MLRESYSKREGVEMEGGSGGEKWGGERERGAGRRARLHHLLRPSHLFKRECCSDVTLAHNV